MTTNSDGAVTPASVALPSPCCAESTSARQSSASSTVCIAGRPGRTSAASGRPEASSAAMTISACGVAVGLKVKGELSEEEYSPPDARTVTGRPAATASR